MGFQLVRATDDEIVIWHMEHGHIFGFQIEPRAGDLIQGWCRDVPEADQRAETVKDAAKLFAMGEARARKLIA